MEKILAALKEIEKMNALYGISSEAIRELREEMDIARVCIPIIGKFSSGKSALVNTLLGYSRKILREDITPETAVPAEIVYSDSEDYITVVENDGTCKQLSVDEFRGFEADATTVQRVRLQLRNSSLERIPDVMLVDMPGFESGFEIHNKAIDNYVPHSLAYIIAVPADDMIIRSSVGNILKELCLHDMPLCVVITKYDKKNDDFELTFGKMQESLKRYVGDREITYCKISSFDGNVKELNQFLLEIQGKSQTILSDKYRKNALSIAENTESYFKTMMKSSQLTESELKEQQEKQKKQLSSLESDFSRAKDEFNVESAGCIEAIKADVQHALEAEESTLLTMVMNKQEIKEQINNIVRNAVTVSVKKHFIPEVEKYLKKAEKTINGSDIGEVHVSFVVDTKDLNKSIIPTIVAVAAGFLMEIPLLGILAGIVLKICGDKKREEAKENIRMKLRNEVFPQVMQEVGRGIETTITKQIQQVNDSIETELKNQKEILEKAMMDLQNKIDSEKTEKERLECSIEDNLERIGEIKNEL